jgi:hypothetical protein
VLSRVFDTEVVHISLRINDDSMIIQRRKKQNRPLVVTSKESGLAVNSETSKYMLMSRHQNSIHNYNIKTDNKFSERVEQFKCFGTTLTNRNFILEETKSPLKSENACYHSVQNLFDLHFANQKHKD